MKKNYERVAEINARLRAIAKAMKTEERDLTDTEKGEIAQLEREKTYLLMQMSATMPESAEPKPLSRMQAYRAAMRAISTAGRAIELQVREEGTDPTSPDVAKLMMTDDLKAGALFPITIQDVIMPLTEDLIYNKIGI